MLTIPVSYQGCKYQLASHIVHIIQPSHDQLFYDCCCGSGAISIELINRGFPAQNIRMIDLSPFGLFWEHVGKGTFDLEYFREMIDQIPKDLNAIQPYLLERSKQTPSEHDIHYEYLILQAGSFGSKSIWLADGRWKNCSFKEFWQPTATSNRRSTVNPMSPMPETLYKRVEGIVNQMKGVQGYCQDVMSISFNEPCTVYCDPPYSGTTQYGFSMDIQKFIDHVPATVPLFVSEYQILSDYYIEMGDSSKHGRISGNYEVQGSDREVLNIFNTRIDRPVSQLNLF